MAIIFVVHTLHFGGLGSAAGTYTLHFEVLVTSCFSLCRFFARDEADVVGNEGCRSVVESAQYSICGRRGFQLQVQTPLLPLVT
jgi:hypothetical protein